VRYRIQRLDSMWLRSAGEHYFRIEDEDGLTRCTLDRKSPARWCTLAMQDANGNELLEIERHGFTPQAEHRISRESRHIAAIWQHWVDGHQRFTVTLPGTENIEIIGDWHAQAFDFMRGDQRLARDEGPWFSWKAPHDVTIASDQDDALILARAVVIIWTNQPSG
jgi:uncharacterized protein YxjI